MRFEKKMYFYNVRKSVKLLHGTKIFVKYFSNEPSDSTKLFFVIETSHTFLSLKTLFSLINKITLNLTNDDIHYLYFPYT